jgi:hypothetical protein
MTTVKNGRVIIEEERAQQCDLCGKIRELRPYGPNGECVCFECMMKDEESAKVRFIARLRGKYAQF